MHPWCHYHLPTLLFFLFFFLLVSELTIGNGPLFETNIVGVVLVIVNGLVGGLALTC